MTDKQSRFKPVRTKGLGGLPVFIKSVGEAADAVQTLPPEVRRQPEWQNAENLLIDACESAAEQDVQKARTAFEVALRKQKWLYE